MLHVEMWCLFLILPRVLGSSSLCFSCGLEKQHVDGLCCNKPNVLCKAKDRRETSKIDEIEVLYHSEYREVI